eukprot:2751258-Alexandrium_andersonii.AAC.1
MSASLVGSEMCIRDRTAAGQERFKQLFAAFGSFTDLSAVSCASSARGQPPPGPRPRRCAQ